MPVADSRSHPDLHPCPIILLVTLIDFNSLLQFPPPLALSASGGTEATAAATGRTLGVFADVLEVIWYSFFVEKVFESYLHFEDSLLSIWDIEALELYNKGDSHFPYL